MTAGLPGVGIGGMFYLATALLMPFRSLWSVLAGHPSEARWGLALRQAAIAAGILGAVWATGWAIGWLIAAFAAPVTAGSAAGGLAATPVRNAVRTATLLGSLCTLAFVLTAVQLLRMVLPHRPTPRNAAALSPNRAQPAA